MFDTPIDSELCRGYLRRRLFEMWVALSGLFFLQVIIYSWVLSWLHVSFLFYMVADLIAGGVTYYTYIIWNEHPIRLRCDSCREEIKWDTPWICSACGHENLNGVRYSFLKYCGRCKAPPKSYTCHHCGKPVFLSEDRDQRNPAERAGDQGRRQKQREGKVMEAKERHEDKEQDIETLKLEVKEESLKAEKRAIKKGVVDVPVRSLLDAAVTALSAHMDRRTAIREAVRRVKAANARDYKDDPAERRRRDLDVDDWAREEIQKDKEKPA